DRGLMLDALEKEVLAGDVVLFMSNGEFDNLPRRLFRRLENGGLKASFKENIE
ncbi:MAG: hypothetical protein JRK53_20680, partial [Deltaproteobacteria bacterium]|nr:hypothetical protein [Deltaproteobacteria bacterium]